MSARIELAGQSFGRWTVEGYAGKQRWTCRCACGVVADVDGSSLRAGRSRGCSACHIAIDKPTQTHGGRHTRLYNIWCKMKARCENPTDAAYSRYGGRGIRVCPQWADDFDAFRRWAVSSGYEDRLTIDRENNDGHYEPSNCRWASYAEQNRNTRRNRPLLYEGRHVIIADLAAEHGLPADIVKNRIRRYGWDIERALTTPVGKRGGAR